MPESAVYFCHKIPVTKFRSQTFVTKIRFEETTMSSVANKNKPEEKRKTGTVSAKQSIKDRREAQRRKQQQQQMLLLGIVAVAVIAAAAIAFIAANAPVEANVPAFVVTRYEDYPTEYLTGVTEEGFPYIGAADAPTVIEEYAAFSCSACKSYHETIYMPLQDLIKAGRVKFVFIPWPRTSFESENATRGAICAMNQGKFWQMQDLLFEWQTEYNTGFNDNRRLRIAAERLGMDVPQFESCLASSETQATLDKFVKHGEDRGVSVTPTTFIDGTQYTLSNDFGLSQIRGIIESKPQ
jgi:protein-disulfide isomerase